MLVLKRLLDESVIINDDIKITIVELRNGSVKLGIIAPKEVIVHREEVFTRIQEAKILEAANKGGALE